MASRRGRRLLVPGKSLAAATLALLGGGACAGPALHQTAYTPRSRKITITTVPLLSRELTSIYPFLRDDFGRTGMMPGKEVYAFVPSDWVVPLPGQTITHATYVARHRGIFPFSCSVAAHLPSMWGQLIVLAPGAIGESAPQGDGSGPAGVRGGPG